MSSKGDSDRELTKEDLKNLEYLDCVMKEALRIVPSVPIIARYISETIQIGRNFIFLFLFLIIKLFNYDI